MEAASAETRFPIQLRSLSGAFAVLVMLAGIVWVYWSPEVPGTLKLAGDYKNLHVHRMRFAREALMGPQNTLPDWYPRELLGTPFWSNIQNFPFLPTRLLILLFDPKGPYTYTFAITLAASLAAVFTYLFALRIGLSPIGSAAAGWTFASCGYFASRTAAGHLPLLEVYCALPLLLWCSESFCRSREMGSSGARWWIALAASSMLIMLGGHPQLPVYALACTGLYLLWRLNLKGAVLPLLGMAVGIGCAAFALLPMALLIGRSTRILNLQRAQNDLTLPYGRILGFFFPWRDGAGMMPRAGTSPFTYANLAIFWDTFCYAGWAPWLAAIALLIYSLVRPVRADARRVAIFLAILGAAGIVLALPLLRQLISFLPGTMLRSPARLIYFTEFALAMAMGGAIHLLPRLMPRTWAILIACIVVVIHIADLGPVSREFHVTTPNANPKPLEQAIEPIWAQIGTGRVSMDFNLTLEKTREFDDIGFFDSIMLARPYSLLIDLTGAPADLNEQVLNGGQFSEPTLEFAGVKFVFTIRERPDLIRLGQLGRLHVYKTRNPSNRADFFPLARVAYVDDDQMRSTIRGGSLDPRAWLLIPRSFMPASRPPDSEVAPATVQYTRPSSDEIRCAVTTSQFGYLRIIESWDSGWTATINGRPVPIIPALGALLAVELPAGQHEVVFQYYTPGRMAGILISVGCVISLLIIGWKIKSAGTRRQ